MNETKSIEREKVTSDRLVANAIAKEIIQQLTQMFPTTEADHEAHIVTPDYWLWAAQQITNRIQNSHLHLFSGDLRVSPSGNHLYAR